MEKKSFKDYFAKDVIKTEMAEIYKKNYLIYASYIIKHRAIPDVRDGMKPINRRILWHMYNSGYSSNISYKKSAKIVGEVLGSYHPHGDKSVYDALVLMSQDFSNNNPTIQGHGNFGTIDGDKAASMRYTEARLSKFAEDTILNELKFNLVEMTKNYSGELMEPTVLPAKVPYLLLNGITGIAIAYATAIPPFNLGEVLDGCIAYVNNKKLTSSELNKIILAPDYPTKGVIEINPTMTGLFTSGMGSLTLKGKLTKEQNKKGEWEFTITEVPYETKPEELVSQIRRMAELQQFKLMDVINAADKFNKVRIIVRFHKSEDDPERLEGLLFTKTNLSKRFSYNMLALKDGSPERLSVLQIIRDFVEFRIGCLFQKFKQEYDKNAEQLHILEGLMKIYPVLDDVIEAIRKSSTAKEAHDSIKRKFKLSDKQAEYILKLPLYRLTKLELNDTKKKKEELEERNRVLTQYMKDKGHNKDVDNYMINEWLEIKKKYAVPRQTLISNKVTHYNITKLMKSKPCMIILTKNGYIKRLPLTPADMVQGKNGKGRNIPGLDPTDEVKEIIDCDTTSELVLITSAGKVYNKYAYDINETQGVGKNIRHIFGLNKKERPVLFTTFSEDITRVALVLANGDVKLSRVSDFKSGVKISPDGKTSKSKKGVKIMKMNNNDELVAAVGLTMKGEDQGIIMASAHGKAININAKEIRVSSRNAGGIKGMVLEGDDYISSACGTASEYITVVTSTGYAKRIETSSIRRTARGSKGVKIGNTTLDDGKILYVGDKSEGLLTIMTSANKMITFDLETIRTTGKNSKGVKVGQLKDGDTLVSVY